MPSVNRFSITVLTMVLLNPTCFTGFASTQSELEKRIKIARTVKAAFEGLDSDQKILAIVDLRNKKKVIGHIEEVRTDRFIVSAMNAGKAMEVKYENILKIKLVVFQNPTLPPVLKINYRCNKLSNYLEKKI